MARGRRNRAEMALQGSFSNLTARIPTNLWEMLNDYARKNKEDIKDARAAAVANINKELGIE